MQQRTLDHRRVLRRAVRVPPHIRRIREAGSCARYASWQVLGDDELLVRQQPNADDEVLDARESDLDALAL